MLSYIPMHRAEAKEAAKVNNLQQKLVADVPSIITCLIVMFDLEIGSASTKKFISSCMDGYNKYGRLHENQLPVMKDIILQHSTQILAAIDSQSNSEKSDVDGKLKNTNGISHDDDVHEGDPTVGVGDEIDEPLPF